MAEYRYCSACGTRVRFGMRYCTGCRAEILYNAQELERIRKEGLNPADRLLRDVVPASAVPDEKRVRKRYDMETGEAMAESTPKAKRKKKRYDPSSGEVIG